MNVYESLVSFEGSVNMLIAFEGSVSMLIAYVEIKICHIFSITLYIKFGCWEEKMISSLKEKL